MALKMNDSDSKKRITITFQPSQETMERLQKAERLSTLSRTDLLNLAIPLGLDELEPHKYSHSNLIRSLKNKCNSAGPVLFNESQEGNDPSSHSIPAPGARGVKYQSGRTRKT